tara:strand:- start:202 stop:429 length:228 start_codon:yes stop_codon:yes gene_type:complete
MTKDTVEVQVYDLFDLVCDAYVASLDDAPLATAIYLDRIKNLAYAYLPLEVRQDFEDYLNNKDYLPPSNLILDAK